jgi:hypothetical protein
MTIFELMQHYFPRKNWRARLATNSAASTIFTLWMFAATFLIGALILLFRDGSLLLCAIFGGVAVMCFAISFLWLTEAKRLHEIRRVMNNSILFGDNNRDL